MDLVLREIGSPLGKAGKRNEWAGGPAKQGRQFSFYSRERQTTA